MTVKRIMNEKVWNTCSWYTKRLHGKFYAII